MDLAVEGNVFGLDETQTPSLADMHARFDDPAIQDGVRDTGGRVTLAIHACRKPVVAAINGAAVGIGATMTLAMDFRLASETARIGFVFGRLGIVPEACSTWFLPRIVGLQQALEWIYTADILDAQEALRGGLVRSLHAPEALLAEAEAFARRLVKDRSPVAVALSRQMLYRNSAQPHPIEAHRIESLAMFYASIGDGKEGVAAFLEKRPARFTGKASVLPSFYDEWTKPVG
jgi:enoyl-CoA hydratase/carnithine racemase